MQSNYEYSAKFTVEQFQYKCTQRIRMYMHVRQKHRAKIFPTAPKTSKASCLGNKKTVDEKGRKNIKERVRSEGECVCVCVCARARRAAMDETETCRETKRGCVCTRACVHTWDGLLNKLTLKKWAADSSKGVA